MRDATSLDRPLVAERTASRGWHRSMVKISLVTIAVTAIGLAFLFLSARPGKDTLPSKSVEEKSASVQEVLKMFPNLKNVKDANEFFARLPPHDQEDMVFTHLIPQSERIFENFLQRHGSSAPHWKTGERLSRRYKFEDANEFSHRLSAFEISLRQIVKLNNVEAKHNLNPNRAIFAINKFADWTWSEFQTLLGRPHPTVAGNATDARPSLKKSQSHKKSPSQKSGTTPPCNKNWAAENPAVYKARQQSTCGSCYAHAAAECLRAHAYINTGIDPGELSVQYIMDCAGNGCNGGLAGNSMDGVASNGGIPTKMAYGPYHNSAQSCKSGIPNAVSTSGGAWTYAERATASALCYKGPVALGVAANNAFQYYASGVLSKAACPASATNHDTQVVGLIKSKGAWLVRNSWGEDWGINPVTLQPGGSAGFIMLEYGENTCNVEDGNAYPKNVECVGSCGSPPAPLPSPPAPSPSSDSFCNNDCSYSSDGACDDGGPGSSYSVCSYGTDCDDCGSRQPAPAPSYNYLCNNDCKYPSDGGCDDGGPGASYSICSYGTDCDDCGPRPAEATCNDDCRWSRDGECDEPTYCLAGTDCTDCGNT